MKVHQDLTSLPQFKDAIVTMGAFDGVHKGHQQIIQRMKQLAQKVQGETIIHILERSSLLYLEKSSN